MLGKLAFRNLFRNKRRTLITAASVFFAVIFALLMRSLQLGVYDNMIENMVGYYTGYAQVHEDGYWVEKSLDNSLEDSPELRAKILADPNIKELVPRFESFALASAGDLTKGVMVIGLDPEAERQIMNLEDKLQEGDYFKDGATDILLAKGLAEYLKISIGDTLVLLGQGYQGTTAAGKYKIGGIVKLGSPDMNNNMVFLSIPSAQNLYAAEDRLTSLILVSNNDREIEGVVQTLQNSLGEKYEVMDWKTMVPELIQLIQADNVGGMIILFILYLIIGFGMFGTILMMTNERIYEFGVLISIGLKRWKLILIMVVESIFVSFLGVVVGIIVGIPLLLYFYYHPIQLGADMADFSAKYDFEPVLHFSLAPEVFYTQAIYVLIIAIVINVYPIFKIWNLKAVEALRA